LNKRYLPNYNTLRPGGGMTYDTIIRGGRVVDGTGAEPFTADVAIKDGLIAEVGKVSETAAREIDADLHTHLDAQIGWDPDMTPISWHGVTTALLGNCGLTFAPCKASDRALLAGMMETVEDIPARAILSGLPWTWEDYGGYLDALEAIGPGLNIAGLVGHAAVRYHVMGDRSFADQATPAEIDAMVQIVARSMDAGAIGFSTNRYEPHKAPDGRSIPGTFADPAELVAIAREVGRRGGLMQAVGAAPEVLKSIADDGGARVLFSWGVGDHKGAGQASREFLDQMCADRDMTAITQVRGTGYMFGLQSGLPFGGETWAKVRDMAFADRLKAVNDAETAARLIAEADEATRLPLKDVYYLGMGETPDYAADRSQNVIQLCRETGERFGALFVRLSRETKGKALFNFRMFCQDLDEVNDLFASDHLFPSLGDAGAHVSQIMDADWSTFMLAYWIRQRGRYSLGEGVRRMTSGPARVMGLTDRGVLARGYRADINVIDFDRVTELQPEIVHDFPGGAPRYIQRAKGYKATLVNGEINVLDDEITGVRAGRVLRNLH
jgi:N-acyl-D-amino-acid deacylase